MNVIVIPARLASKRLPNKLLRMVLGKPLIWHTIQRALESQAANQIIVATEDRKIYDAVMGFDIEGVEAHMTGPAQSGTARIASISKYLAQRGCRKIVNFQGDEPLLPGFHADYLFKEVGTGVITTIASPIISLEFNSPHVVKVVTDHEGNALYFSRSGIPYNDPASSLRHIGIYAYPIEFLLGFEALIETTYYSERLEQLSWLQSGWKIRVIVSDDASLSLGIDTEEEFEEFVKRVSGPS